MENKIIDMLEQRKQALVERSNKIKNAAERMIWVSFQREGLHCYPAAATDPKLEDVSFLGNVHRHMFHFKDRKSTRLNSSHSQQSRMPSSA